MSYQIPYVAEFECPKGHKFMSEVQNHKPICPTCYKAWIEANVSTGTQVGEARPQNPGVAFC